MSNDTENRYKTPADDTQYWYVMTHLEPSLAERQLQLENARRLSQGHPSLLYMIPYRYLVKAGLEPGWEDEAARSKERRQAMQEAAANNNLRDSLHSFVFIRATEDEITALTGMDWNREGRLHLYHYRTKSGRPIRVSQSEMRPFLVFFIRQRQRFSFTSYSEELSANGTVYIRRGVFKDRQASVIEVHHTARGISLTLGLPMFRDEVMLNVYDCPLSDVEVPSRMEHLFEPQFVTTLETDLLGILRRRVLRRDTADTLRDDMDRLNAYSLLHYLKFESTSTHAHFQSLLLLCAVLRHDSQARNALVSVIRDLIPSPESPTTDAEAFHLSVLFFATKDVGYRKALREYGQTHAIGSPSLAAILPLVKKLRLRPVRAAGHGTR